MPPKWNKKICIEYITQLKSPLEESAGMGNNGQKSKLQQMAEAMRRMMSRGKSPEVV